MAGTGAKIVRRESDWLRNELCTQEERGTGRISQTDIYALYDFWYHIS
jgi:hypothetical protein